MLEGLVAWVLNNYLGKYVENLNTDQLSVALLSGKVELENLPLKKDALRHLGLPVEVKAGFIGKVQLHVPVSQLRSAPWIIAIEKLYVVVTPVNLDEWDSELEAHLAHERKVSLLDALEAQWRAELEATDAGYYASSYSSWLSYGTGMLAHIAETLQLKLNDVHIRFEDSITCAPAAFACGLSIGALVAETCDAEWRRGGSSGAGTHCAYKLIELQQLAVYWDPVEVPSGLLANYSPAELTTHMSETWRSAHRYVSRPASAAARVRRERSEQPLRSRQRPRIKCTLALDTVHLEFTSRQYSEAVRCVRGLERISSVRAVRSGRGGRGGREGGRPTTTPSASPRDWWRYAVRAHCPHHRWMDERPTWESCLAQSRLLRQYVATCVTSLAAPAATLPPADKAAKDDYEWNNELALLKALREIAMRKVTPLQKPSPASTPDKPSSGRSMLVQWFPQWWGWYSSAPGQNQAAQQTKPKHIEDEILDAIADTIENNTMLKRDTVFGLFEFMLEKGSLVLKMVNGDGEEESGSTDNAGSAGSPGGPGGFVELSFSGVTVGVESRPRDASLALRLTLGEMRLCDPGAKPLIAPQGMIRAALSELCGRREGTSSSRAPPSPPPPPPAPLLHLEYEKKPYNYNCDHRLYVKSSALEVVYNPSVVSWLRKYLESGAVDEPLAAVSQSTRRLIGHWKHMMQPHVGPRRSWSIELDISAPTILLGESLVGRDAALLLVDLGRLRLQNDHARTDHQQGDDDDDDDEERYMTPCSTPPGSPQSPASPPAPPAAATAATVDHSLEPNAFHDRLYDRYNIELSDLQVLVGQAKDYCKYGNTRSTSALHLLDKFTISLQAERRVVWTSDPAYPAGTACGTLPSLAARLSEAKLTAARRAIAALTQRTRDIATGKQPEPAAKEQSDDDTASECSESEVTESFAQDASRFFMLQFAVQHVSVEIQSRGRSIAEVVVRGVRLALSGRRGERALSLSVHSLLVGDALQTAGHDCDLLVASHRDVGMDVSSGSIRGSEPTSPASPASPGPAPPAPDPALTAAAAAAYLSSERRHGRSSVPPSALSAPGLVDSEALIAVELVFVRGEGGAEDLRIANILFNNLDIIANQETIVELIGFWQRVSGSEDTTATPGATPHTAHSLLSLTNEQESRESRTEITFDFHRLGVLLLRASGDASRPAAHKIATFTLTEAKIQATVASSHVSVSGSLGGVHVVSLCGSGPHSRVLSAGWAAPAPHAAHEARHTGHTAAPDGDTRPTALSFEIQRTMDGDDGGDIVEVSVAISSVLYVHCGALVAALRQYTAELRDLLAELARSLRAAATDMARHMAARADSLYSNPKLSHSSEGVYPRRRTVSASFSLEDPPDTGQLPVDFSISVELESPVVVLPRGERGGRGGQVLVAHLGAMRLGCPPRAARLHAALRHIALRTLDVTDKLNKFGLTSDTVRAVYDAGDGAPVLHETALQLDLNYDATAQQWDIKGNVVGGVQVSASRQQYEQLLDTLSALARPPLVPAPHTDPPASVPPTMSPVSEVAVPTLRLDPTLRAQVFAPRRPRHSAADNVNAKPHKVQVNLEVCVLSAELRGGRAAPGVRERRPLVLLACRELCLHYRHHGADTKLQMSLHSVTVEDLTQEPDSKHRMLLLSHTPQVPKAVFVSKSCPDFITEYPTEVLIGDKGRYQSLKSGLDKLDCGGGKGATSCPTPPCSPQNAGGEKGLTADDNLVYISIETRDQQHEDFEKKYNKVGRETKVEFNCLQLVLNVDSWSTVLDFFGLADDDGVQDTAADVVDAPDVLENTDTEKAVQQSTGGISQTEMSIRSLGIVLVQNGAGIARARVLRVAVTSSVELGGGGAVGGGGKTVTGRLGALDLHDLTPHGAAWRERLTTHGEHALTFQYRRLPAAECLSCDHDAQLSLSVCGLTYVHTARFAAALQRALSPRPALIHATKKVSPRLRLSVQCSRPTLVVPVSGCSAAALAAHLAAVSLDTHHMMHECGELVHERTLKLSGVRIWCANGHVRQTPAILATPADFSLVAMAPVVPSHTLPDMTIRGQVSRVEVRLEPRQYRLLRGVLAHNLADSPAPPTRPEAQVWKTSCMKLDLQDVRIRLAPSPSGASATNGTTATNGTSTPSGSSGTAQGELALLHLQSCRLLIDASSDGSRDVELYAQEIVITDTRYNSEPANRRGNVFSNIVTPLPAAGHALLQVHGRKHNDLSSYTIIINNMRLMAILDWWEAASHFILQPPAPPQQIEDLFPSPCESYPAPEAADNQYELKLNITESQLVLVEDASLWDTNAVILKSTTVIQRRVTGHVSCWLTQLEVFSCVLGLEEETALAILPPAQLQATLPPPPAPAQISTSNLQLRLSYHDMKMFAAMLRSLPVQAKVALAGKFLSEETTADEPANLVRQRSDTRALHLPLQRLAELQGRPPTTSDQKPWPIQAIEFRAECISLCVIDDCLDSDVPLLDISITDFLLEQDLRKVEEAFADPMLVCTPATSSAGVGASGAGGGAGRAGAPGAAGGRLSGTLALDYYNRALSGWEPVIEPTKFECGWEHTLSSSLSLGRLQVSVRSAGLLDVNVTSSLVELAQLVRRNWTEDYYGQQNPSGPDASPKHSPSGHRRRNPFVPYALRNHTGHTLWFTTLASDTISECTAVGRPDDSWVCVRAGHTEPFSFGGGVGGGGGGGWRAARRTPRLLRLALRLEGWSPPEPVCVDRVNVYFRNVTHQKSGAEARIVLEVSLEGSARKLVTVRSALQLLNKLPHALELSLQPTPKPYASSWSGSRGVVWSVSAGARWSCPLAAAAEAAGGAALLARVAALPPRAPPAHLAWRHVTRQHTAHLEFRAQDQFYKFTLSVGRERFPAERGAGVAGGAGVEGAAEHTLHVLPALRVENLLPAELQCRARHALVALPPGAIQPLTQVSMEEGLELSVKTDGFSWSSGLALGGAGGAGGYASPPPLTVRVKLKDERGRRLYLNARITFHWNEGFKVSISAPYWIVNRLGLPLVFGVSGAGDAAGQGAEHELARHLQPLPFSLTDADSATLSARLGRALDPSPQWCSPFGLGPGTCVKRISGRDSRGTERVYWATVSTRAGRGRYRCTNIVTLTPRHRLHNDTGHTLQIARPQDVSSVTDPSSSEAIVTAVPGCLVAWHWAGGGGGAGGAAGGARELVVRAVAPRRSAWSGAVRADEPRTRHLACRWSSGGGYLLLRVEVAAARGALLVLLADDEAAAAPLRVHNASPVALMMHQVGSTEECVVGAGSSLRWALPAPEGPAALVVRAPGGPRATLKLDVARTVLTLPYQNFVYVAFVASTVKDHSSASCETTDPEKDDNVLVLEVPIGSNKVQLGKKRYGDRCQLWRVGAGGQLVHEGSSPPQPTHAAPACPPSPHDMVLDIEGPAPRPTVSSPLCLRRVDPRRVSTQTWRVTDGRLRCAHPTLCVQPRGGLLGLLPGGRVVLGLSSSSSSGAVPAEQRVSWARLRPGSGRLTLALRTQAGAAHLTITDGDEPTASTPPPGQTSQATGATGATRREYALSVQVCALGVSLVSRAPPEELLYATLRDVRVHLDVSAAGTRLALTLGDMQFDNQLLGTPSPVLLYCLAGGSGGAGGALRAELELGGAAHCRHLVVSCTALAARLEERLVLKLLSWASLPDDENATEEADETEAEMHRVVQDLTAPDTRYYFGLIKIVPSQIRLSMFTANKLEPGLAQLKRRLGLTLIRFEDAAVELEPFVRRHVHDAPHVLVADCAKHFKDELKWQAAKILGSVDFLGNPLGFVSDVSQGVSGLIYEGSFRALVKNVTHGISNSAAKVTESLGDGLERVVPDEAHEETRRRIRAARASPQAHLAAGVRGLGLGLLGGMTSLVKHSYEGAAAEGLGGLLAGVGKGLVGTVTKPVIGVLDLAAETAAALRDTSRRSDKCVPSRIRAPRCAAGPGGLLPRYDGNSAAGAHYLYQLNRADPTDCFLAYQLVRDTPHDIRALLSTHYLRIFTCKHHTPQIVMETHLSNLVSCQAVEADGAHYVELGVRGGGAGGAAGAGAGAGEALRRPRVQCDSAALAAALARHAALARQLYHEAVHTLQPYNND